MSKLRLIKPKSYTIEIAGVDYELTMTMASFALIEEKYGSIQEAFSQVEQSKMSAVLFCVWACLSEQLPEKEFYRHIDLNSFKKLAEMLADLVKSAMPEDIIEGTPEKKN